MSFVDFSCCWGCRAEEEERGPGPAGERQQEPEQEGEQGGGRRLSETQGPPTAAAPRNSGAGHACGAHLGMIVTSRLTQEESSAALCDGSFTELERWEQSVYTLSMHIWTHRHTHTGPMFKHATYIHVCAHVHACTHTHTQPRPPEDTSISQTSPQEQGGEVEGVPFAW